MNIPLLKQKYLKQNHVQDKREDKIAKFPQVTVAVTIHFTIFKSVFEGFESIYKSYHKLLSVSMKVLLYQGFIDKKLVVFVVTCTLATYSIVTFMVTCSSDLR